MNPIADGTHIKLDEETVYTVLDNDGASYRIATPDSRVIGIPIDADVSAAVAADWESRP